MFILLYLLTWCNESLWISKTFCLALKNHTFFFFLIRICSCDPCVRLCLAATLASISRGQAVKIELFPYWVMSVVSTVNSERDLITWHFVIEGKNKKEREKENQRLVKRDKEKVVLLNHWMVSLALLLCEVLQRCFFLQQSLYSYFVILHISQTQVCLCLSLLRLLVYKSHSLFT